jgi:hypothetical protein
VIRDLVPGKSDSQIRKPDIESGLPCPDTGTRKGVSSGYLNKSGNFFTAEQTQYQQENDSANESGNDLTDKAKIHPGEKTPGVTTSQASENTNNDLAEEAKADSLNHHICQDAGNSTNHDPDQNIRKHNNLLS